MLEQIQTLKYRLQFHYTNHQPLMLQSFPIFLNDIPVILHLDKQGYSQELELPESLENSNFCKIDHFEMIDHNTGFPTHCQTFSKEDFIKHSTESKNSLPIIFPIKVLPPPMIIDLHYENALLSPEHLQYFKDNGNNALIFVHGYDLPLGDYGYYPESYEIQPDLGISEFQYKNSSEHIQNYHLSSKQHYCQHHTLNFKKSPYRRSIACKLDKPDEILARFPELLLSYPQHFSKLCHNPSHNPEGLGDKEAFFNGTHARHWFTHIEYNFNCAAGFSGKNFEHYTRILNIHWPSGSGMTEYKLAERMATQSAGRFVKIIQQLIAENIKIHIVAHSLGSRLVLDMLRSLVEPNEIKLNGVEQIKAKEQKTSSRTFKSIDDDYPIENLILWQAAIPHTLLFEDPLYCEIPNLVRKINVLYSKNDRILQTLYSTAQLNQCSLIKALGYAGPPANDIVKVLQKAGKLICADQTQLLLGHSFMKIPTEQLMREIYQEYIIGGSYGVSQFGRYTLF